MLSLRLILFRFKLIFPLFWRLKNQYRNQLGSPDEHVNGERKSPCFEMD